MKSLVVGADGGLGSRIRWELIRSDVSDVFRLGNEIDITDDVELREFIRGIEPVDKVVHAAGVNLICPFESVTQADFFESIDVNCFSFVRLIQFLIEEEKLNEYSQACLITSNAANIPMTHSLSYNCSKAAANMAIQQMGREIRIKDCCIFGVAPNKLAGTPMSKAIEDKVQHLRGWTPEQAEKYQLAALPARRETPPTLVAEFVVNLLLNYQPYIHGTVIPFGGPQ